MQTIKFLIPSILVCLIARGFSGDLDQNKTLETYEKLLELLLAAEKSNTSINQNASLASDNKTINIFVSIVVNNPTPNGFSFPGVSKKLIDVTCSSDKDCAVKNSRCFLNTCQCSDGFYLQDDTCYQYADSLRGICQSDEGCKKILHSSCIDGHCLCLPNYNESSGSCLGMINATCNDSKECLTFNTVCNGTCQCPDNSYFEDNHCSEYAKRLYKPVASAQACQRLTNTIFIGKWCECLPGHYDENNHCHQIPLDYKTPVASAKACSFLEEAFYFEGKCYNTSSGKLHIRCNKDDDCAVSFSKCFKGKCKCKNGYHEQKNVCYAPRWDKCNTPKDCPLIWYSCVSGTCKIDSYYKNGKQIPLKPEATAVWDENKYYTDNFYNSSYFSANTSHQVGDPGNLAWVRNYTLDRVVAFDIYYSNLLIIWCRAKNTTGHFVPGRVKFPDDRVCQVDYNQNKFSTSDYQVYVDLGPK